VNLSQRRESQLLNKTILSEFRKEYENANKIEDKSKRDKVIAEIEALDENLVLHLVKYWDFNRSSLLY
jgi:hypothetical protein